MGLLRRYERFLERRYAFETRADELHRVKQDDGQTLIVKCFRAHNNTPRREQAILCVPGLGSDSTNFDCPGDNCLAVYFASQGFDTFVVDLRGTGLSTLNKEQSRADKKRWGATTFDDFLNDVPNIVQHVQKSSRRERVLWVGHSMGGLVLHGALATAKANGIHAAITICTPMGFPQGWQASPALGRVKGMLELLPSLNFQRAVRLATPIAFKAIDKTSPRYAVLENLDLNDARRLLYTAVQDFPKGVAMQFRDWIDNDVFRSLDKRIDYRARLAGTTLPIMVTSAVRDALAPPESAKRALDLFVNAESFECSKAAGLSADYGHCDVVFGKEAPREIFPRFLEFALSQEARPRHALVQVH